jgi:Flp pilus assembly pilin Flp
MQALIEYFTHPALWISVLIIGLAGQVAKKLILGDPDDMPKNGYRGFKGVYYVTYKAHAVIVGAMGGMIPGLPVTEAMETDGMAGSVMFYAGAGALAMIVYASVVGTIKNAFENYSKKLAEG